MRANLYSFRVLRLSNALVCSNVLEDRFPFSQKKTPCSLVYTIDLTNIKDRNVKETKTLGNDHFYFTGMELLYEAHAKLFAESIADSLLSPSANLCLEWSCLKF